ncbi:major facilitator superfamily [Stylonychia lemnae]|uniref:Major facilitator superfamily n=1 Tax=Stylonychia lemnae TaxID=5949 RepID=A0A078AP37_STYLE|nr:major facilitator superfamily [Stylonychia lemnae]|eukprot:CDW83082.1 major facilitator superfamily [Stylonychia lemnae]
MSQKSLDTRLDLDFDRIYPTRYIVFLYGLIFFCNVLINIDHGSIPAATLNLKQDLNIDNFELGLLGSLVYLGLTIGSILATPIFTYIKAKTILILSFCLNAFSLILFTISEDIVVFVCIYFPVWVDTFGTNKHKTLWLSLLLLAPPIGVVLGYSLTAFMVYHFTWRYIFYLQSILVIPCVIAMISIPNKYFDIETAIQYIRKDQNRQYDLTQMYQTGGTGDGEYEKNRIQRKGSPEARRRLSSIGQNYISRNNLNNLNDEEQLPPAINPTAIFLSVLKNKPYILITIALSILFFVITGIQFWVSDYLQVILNVDAQTVFVYFSFTCITGPTIGVIVGGVIIHRQGGYKSPKALRTVVIVAFLANAVALPIPFVDNFQVFALLIWFLLFFGGFIVPIMTGLILTVVKTNERTIANSLANLSYNILGYLPSPFVYGLVQNQFGGNKSRAGMILLMYSALIAFFSVLVGYIIQEQKKKPYQKFSINNKQLSKNLIDDQNQENGVKSPEDKYSPLRQQYENGFQQIQGLIDENQTRIRNYSTKNDSSKNIILQEFQTPSHDYKDYLISPVKNSMYQENSFDSKAALENIDQLEEVDIVKAQLSKNTSFFEPFARLHNIQNQ